MPVTCVEISKQDCDRARSHIRLERRDRNRYVALGCIAHPDLLNMTVLPARVFIGRRKAIEAAAEMARIFGLPEVWLIG